ncbi:MAG: hypothetical protein ACRDPA_28095, partial [Solirubrobacteraceae bacterium]
MRRRRSLALALVVAGLGGATLAAAADASPLSFSRPVKIRPRRGPTALRSWGGVACPSVHLCVASDGIPRILTSSHPTGDRRAWTIGPIGQYGYISSLACASASLCVAGGSDNLVTGFYVSTDPAAGAASWSFEGPVFSSVISSVACPAVSLCVAGDEAGDILTSTDPTGGPGAWSVVQIERRGFFDGLSCPSVRLCVAADLDGAIYTSTDPAGGAATWHRTRPRGRRGWFDVTCPTRRLCVAAGSGLAVSTRPARARSWHWSPMPRNRLRSKDLMGLSCPSARICLGADITGQAFVSTDPKRGARGWQVIRLHRSNLP